MSLTWRERIAEARERGRFTREDRHLACEFETCAVGEVHERIPESRRWLRWGFLRLGAQFLGAVKRDRFYEAERVLERIEDLALQLKREQSG